MAEAENYHFDEVIYYKRGYAFISNKKIIFIGFEEDSKKLGKYEISTGNILKIYREKSDSLLNTFLKAFNQSSNIRVEASINGKVITYTPIADEYTKDEYREEMQKLYNSLHEAQSRFKKEIESIEDKKKLSILKVQFREKIQLNGDFEINIPNVDSFSIHLDKNQYAIANFDKKWIHDLVKIKSYLQSANTSIKNNFKQTLEEDDLEYFKQMQAEVINQVEAYDKVYGNALILIDSIIESNHVLSYEIYEIFDKLGFFESNWEQRLIQKIDDLADSIEETNTNTINEKFDLITNTNISKMTKGTDSPSLTQAAMPLLTLYGGYKLGYHMFGPSKK